MAERISVCADCEQTFAAAPRGAIPARCKPCTRAHNRVRVRAWHRDRYVPVVRERPCRDCGETYAASGKDTSSFRCPACRVLASRAARQRWAERNREREAEHRRQYRLANQDKVRERRSRHRAKRRGATVERFLPREIFDRDGWVCQLCDEQVPEEFRFPHPQSASLDHVVPLSRGGEHSRANTQLACLRCNQSKGARVVGEGG